MTFAAQLTSWPPYLFLALITAVFIGLAWLGVNLRHRLLSRETMEANKELIAAVFNNTAILYTVLLAFMVVGVWGEYNKALAGAEHEPASLIAVAKLVQAFPPASPAVLQLRAALATYCDDVLFAIVELNYPFIGEVSVQQGGFHAVQEALKPVLRGRDSPST